MKENKGILDHNKAGEAVVYGEAILGSNFKLLFTSLICRQQDLRQVGIGEFFRALWRFGITKNDLSGVTFSHM